MLLLTSQLDSLLGDIMSWRHIILLAENSDFYLLKFDLNNIIFINELAYS